MNLWISLISAFLRILQSPARRIVSLTKGPLAAFQRVFSASHRRKNRRGLTDRKPIQKKIAHLRTRADRRTSRSLRGYPDVYTGRRRNPSIWLSSRATIGNPRRISGNRTSSCVSAPAVGSAMSSQWSVANHQLIKRSCERIPKQAALDSRLMLNAAVNVGVFAVSVASTWTSSQKRAPPGVTKHLRR